MPASLPPQPNLRFLQLQAKALLKAQRTGHPKVCDVLRLLDRFHDAPDAHVLQAHVALHEAQFALALHYGFKSWPDLRRHLQAGADVTACTLDAVRLRTPDEIPEYAAAGVPLAIVAALNHAGSDLDFVDFAAASGWAFSFGYHYADITPAFMAVRGRPGHDDPPEIFATLPKHLGYDFAFAPTAQLDQLWPFVVRHVDAGTPIISEHLDGGLITNHRQTGRQREIFFDGTVGTGWIAADQLQPFAVYVLVRAADQLPPDQLLAAALQRAAAKAAPHAWQGVPQGLAALNAYRADVADPAKTFAEVEEWFCWAAFERLLARQCCATWLRRIAPRFAANITEQIVAAAAHYATAYGHYERYRAAIVAGEPSTHDLQQRVRTPGRITHVVSILDAAIAAETTAIESLHAAAGLVQRGAADTA